MFPTRLAAARRWVPVLIGIMAGAFAAYLAMKGLKKIVDIEPWPGGDAGHWRSALPPGWSVRPIIRRQSDGMENRKRSR